jgi:hypothetical protein
MNLLLNETNLSKRKNLKSLTQHQVIILELQSIKILKVKPQRIALKKSNFKIAPFYIFQAVFI